MKVKLDRIDGLAEAYSVTLEVDGKVEGGKLVGRVVRQAGDRWDFVPRDDIEVAGAGGPDAIRIGLIASTPEQLAELIGRRFAAVAVPMGNPDNDVMEKHTTTVLHSLNVMACNTETMPGLMGGIVNALAAIVHEDVAPDKKAGFMPQLVEKVAARVAALEATDAAKDKFLKAMKRIFTETDSGGAAEAGEGNATKH